MIRRSIHKSFRGTRLQYSRHAHVLLQSNISSVLLLTLMFLFSNSCYQSLKKRVDAERVSHLLSDSLHQPAAASAGGLLFSWGLDSNYRLGRMGGDLAAPQVTLAQLEVVGVAASRHSLLVTRGASVWSMGSNDSTGGGGHGSKGMAAAGQLGRPGSWAPAPVLGALQRLEVRQAAAGRYHSVALTTDGRVFTWGLNDWGQLGRPGAAAGGGPQEAAATQPAAAAADTDASAATITQPRQPYLKDERLPHRKQLLEAQPAAAAAQPATGADGQLVRAVPSTTTTTTPSSSSTCTSGWSCHNPSPQLVEALGNVSVVAVKAGRYSTMALDAAGQLWVWGFDGCASGGEMPQQEDAWRPRLVQGQLQGQRVVAFDVGYTFWLAATDDGALYTCDTTDDGYAGTLPEKRKPNNAGQLGRTGAPNAPGRVRGPLLHKVVSAVAAGREHALAATADGQLYSFGGGRATLGRDGPADEPRLVAGGLDGLFIRHVAAGEYFSLAATDSMVFGWGSNAFMCTGTGQSKDQDVLQPTPVAGPLGTGEWTILTLAAGYQHAFAVADQPGGTTVAKIRSEALGVGPLHGSTAGVGTATVQSGIAPVEVILTDEQRLQRQQAQQDAAAQALVEQQAQPQLPASQDTQAHPLSTAAAAEALVAGSSSPSAVALTEANATAGDYHWHYLAAQQTAPTTKVHEVWAQWQPSAWHDALAALSPDVFKLLPKEYNTMHKNPCWGGEGPQLACLPYFNVIGVSKCGTTDLYHRLTLYKQHILPATNKGPHFWDECPFPPQGPCQAGPSGDFQAYINLFSRAADLIRTRPNAITGEASSNTFTSANGIYLRGFRGGTPVSEWAGAVGVNATMPALLREAQPYLRLILMLRDPVARYYSAYNYYRWWLKGEAPPTPDDFHSHAVRVMQQWTDCVAAKSVAKCVRRFQPQQLIKGMYAEFLPDWLAHWPRQQLLILRYEDYIAALPQHLQAVLHFLGVEEPDAGTLAAMTGAAVQNKKAYLPMRADTRQMLEAFYAPFNTALVHLLDDQRWAWKE